MVGGTRRRHRSTVEGEPEPLYWQLGLSVYRCVAAGVKPKTTVRERCDGARARPNPSCPLPLGHCWDGQMDITRSVVGPPATTSILLLRPGYAERLREYNPNLGGGFCQFHWYRIIVPHCPPRLLAVESGGPPASTASAPTGRAPQMTLLPSRPRTFGSVCRGH